MALGKNEKSLCNKLIADWNGLLAPVYALRSTIMKAKNDMLNKLKEMVEFHLFTFPISDLTDALDDFEQDVKDQLPGDELDDLQRIKDFLEQCKYLQSLEPISAIIGTALGISDEINNLINNFFDALDFPEFGAANFGSVIDNLLNAIPGLPGGDALAALLEQADKLLQCLGAACNAVHPDSNYHAQFEVMSNELTALIDDLNLDHTTYEFNYEKLYGPPPDGAGLTPDERNAIVNTKDKLNAAKNNGVNAVDGAKNAMQQASKIGGLFS